MRREDDRPNTPLPFEDQINKLKKRVNGDGSNHSNIPIKSSIHEVLSGARATISQPSRPFTPRETFSTRKLFYDKEYLNRPNSAISISSSNFKVLVPIRPPSQEEPRNGELETEEQIQRRQMWNGVQSLLQLMDPENNSDRIMEAADSLFLILASHHDEFSDNQQRTILQRVSKLMDNKDAQILFKMTAIILQLSPDGPFLLSTCKLLFSLSKKTDCDKMFREEKVLDPLIKLLRNQKQEKSWETWLFSIAALKNISTDSQENQIILLKYRVIAVLSHILQLIDQSLPSSDQDETNRHAQLLVQVTSLLRNLSSSSKCVKQFTRYQVLNYLYPLMESLVTHAEFIHNCCRILSKISIHYECRLVMMRCPYIPCMMRVIEQHKLNKPIVMRACFVLGNLTFSDYRGNVSPELHRHMISVDKGVPLLLDILEMYDNHEKKKSDARLRQETEDLLTKLIRLIANVALHEEQGRAIVASPKIARVVGLMERKPVAQCEELVLNIVRCITNLSFYALSGIEQEETSPLFADQVKIAKCIVKFGN
jgi:hypothetical protein